MERKTYNLASCNVEGDKNTLTVRDFLMTYTPDIVCFQEAPQGDVTSLANELDYNFAFRANVAIKKVMLPHITKDNILGLAILAKNKIEESGQHTYRGDPDKLPLYVHGERNSPRKEILYAVLPHNIKVATTHFTWSRGGRASKEQREDIEKLVEETKLLGEFIFAGDFNSPRPGEIYTRLTENFKDNIPPGVETSIDPTLHKMGNQLHLLVDYIFTTPSYKVLEVELIEGVSDHKAILAKFQKLPTLEEINSAASNY
jgi:endonuclease/exonuclease/phosphatase family metal-dependent hydrolase